jgi:tryptophan synthase alpha chain
VSGVQRIAEAFARSAAEGRRAALMPYLMGGFPDLQMSRKIGLAYAQAGADLIELGVPFSDPLADGAVIHAAGTAALTAGATLPRVLDVAAGLATRVPVVVMCYANLILHLGVARLAAQLAAAGVSGLIVPDLPLEESAAVLDACDAHGVALVPLVAPTTSSERLTRIGAQARGFLYCVSLTGTTGERPTVDTGLREVIHRAAAATDVPVAVGFGIATPQHAITAADAGAQGVIVGSRLVRAAAGATDPPAAVTQLIRDFSEALRPAADHELADG